MKIIIPTLRKKINGKVLVEELVKKLKETTDAEIIILDNPDKKWNDCIIENVKDDDDYMIMDDDIVIKDRDWFKKMKAYTHKYDVMGFKLLHEDNSIQHFGGNIRIDGWGYHPHDGALNYGMDYDHTCPYVTFSVVYIKKEVLEKINIMDEAYLDGSYYEDVDFCFRAREKGFTIGVVPIEFYHLESFTKKQDKNSQELTLRNKNIFNNKWRNEILKNYHNINTEEDLENANNNSI